MEVGAVRRCGRVVDLPPADGVGNGRGHRRVAGAEVYQVSNEQIGAAGPAPGLVVPVVDVVHGDVVGGRNGRAGVAARDGVGEAVAGVVRLGRVVGQHPRTAADVLAHSQGSVVADGGVILDELRQGNAALGGQGAALLPGPGWCCRWCEQKVFFGRRDG